MNKIFALFLLICTSSAFGETIHANCTLREESNTYAYGYEPESINPPGAYGLAVKGDKEPFHIQARIGSADGINNVLIVQITNDETGGSNSEMISLGGLRNGSTEEVKLVGDNGSFAICEFKMQ